MGYRVLVCGSRTWITVTPIAHALLDIHHMVMRAMPNDQLVIIHGGAAGADTCAEAAARAAHFAIERYPADWDKHGKKAGVLRNQLMIETQPDLVLAFWDGVSRGTSDMIERAVKAGTPVIITFEDGTRSYR